MTRVSSLTARRLRAPFVLVATAALVATGVTVTLEQGAQASPCDTSLVGWAAAAGGTTGGGNASPQTVTSIGDLRKLAGDSTKRVLRISGSISTGSSPVDVSSNKTIVGADGSARIVGGLNIKSGNSNIIIRNLTIQGTGYGNYPADTIGARGSHHIWYDHLDLRDAGDGLLDNTRGIDYVTVSWTKFSYSKKTPHRFAALVGGGADHNDTDKGRNRVTYHHNWFAELVDQRMPRVLFGQGHVYNNYYTSSGNTYAVGVGAYASVLVENNYFKGVRNPHQFMYDLPHYITARGNVYDNTSGTKDSGAGGKGGGVSAFTNPPYSYTAAPASSIPDTVSSCAGPRI